MASGDRALLDELRRMDSLQERSSIPRPSESPYSFRNIAGAAIEPNLSLLSGAIAGPASGLAGIAGSLLPGEEGQGAEWTRKVGQALSYQPVTQGGQTAQEAISYPFRKLAEGADYLGGKTSDVLGPAAGAAVNAAVQTIPAALLAKGVQEAPSFIPGRSFPQWASENLMQKAIKPSPSDLVSGDAQRAALTMLEKNISPTAGGLVKWQKLLNKTHGQAETAFNENPLGMVSTSKILDRLQIPEESTPIQSLVGQTGPAPRAILQSTPNSDISAVQGVRQEFLNSPAIREQARLQAEYGPQPGVQGDVQIPVRLAHAIKKGTYQSIGDKAYGELGTTSTQAQKALARGLREESLAATPGAAAPLSDEASLMNIGDVAANKVLARGNVNPLGLAGLRIRDLPEALTFLSDRSPWFKGWLARMLYRSPKLTPPAVAGSAINEGQQ